MQWMAMVTMLIDHIGAVWFQDQSLYRIVGRIAFPIYAYYVVQGMNRTSNRRRYVIRLGILALLSQLPYSLLFDTYTINVIGTFFVCVLGLYGFYEARYAVWLRWVCLVASAAVLIMIKFDYGIYALILMLIYRHAEGIYVLLGHLGLNMIYIFGGLTSPLQIYSLLPSILFSIPDVKVKQIASSRRTPKYLWRAFYPGHLLVLVLIRLSVGS